MGSLEDRHKSNGARLSRLLIDKGTDAMRKSFDSIISSTTLSATLSSSRTFLQKLQKLHFISQCQMDILFPPCGAPSHSKDFDITLLFILLRYICGLHPPHSTGSWNENPPPGDDTLEANLARIKYYRNKVYGHITTTGVKDSDFDFYWNDISAAVVGLGVSEGDVQCLKHSPLEENLFLNQIKEWKEKENALEVILKEMNGALKALPLGQEEKFDAVMKETNTGLEAISQILSDNHTVFHENQKETKAIMELLLRGQQEMKQLQRRDSAVVDDKEKRQIEELEQTRRELEVKKRILEETNRRKQGKLKERQHWEEAKLSKRQREEVGKQNERQYREKEELKKRQHREQEELKERHSREQDELEKQHVKEQEELNEREQKDWEKQQEEERRLEKQKQVLEKQQRVRKRHYKEQHKIRQQQVEEQRQTKSDEQTRTKQQKLEEQNKKEIKRQQKLNEVMNIETDKHQRLEEHKRKEFEEQQRREKQNRQELEEQQILEEQQKNSKIPELRVNRRVTNKLQRQRLNTRPWSMIAYSEIQSITMGEVPQHQTLPRSKKAQCNSVKDLVDEQWSMNQSYTTADATSSKNSRDPALKTFLKIPFKNLNDEELDDDDQKLQCSWSMTSLLGDVSLSTSSTISSERIGNTAHSNKTEEIFDEQWDMNQSNTGEASSSKNSKNPKLKTFFKNVFKNLKQKKRGKNNQKLECSRSTANLPRTVSLSSSSSSSPNLTGSTGKSKPLRSKSLAIINK